MTLPTLRTERLTLRALAPEDANTIAGALNNLNVSRWLTAVVHPYTRDDAAWFINENVEGRMHARLIWDGDRFVGTMGIDGELGYWLAEDAWGNGYATEAGRTVVDEYFQEDDRQLLNSSHFLENKASLHVLSKLGFIETGEHIHHCAALGQDVPGRLMSLTRDRWRGRGSV